MTEQTTNDCMNIPPLVSVCRRIVYEHQYKSVNSYSGIEVPDCNDDAVIIDAFTAGMVTAVYDALNDENKLKFNRHIIRYGVIEFIDRMWACVK